MQCNQNNNCNMFSQQAQPIIMPTQVLTRQVVSCVEQPVIFPVECRTVNRVILVPRFYRAYSNSCMTNPAFNNNCPNG